MTSLHEIAAPLLERDPSIAVGTTDHGEILHRARFLICARTTTDAVQARLSRWIENIEPMPDLRVDRIQLIAGTDAVTVVQGDSIPAAPVHVFTTPQALATPVWHDDAINDIFRQIQSIIGRGASLLEPPSAHADPDDATSPGAGYLDELQLARLLAVALQQMRDGAQHSPCLIPYVGWTFDDRPPRALRALADGIQRAGFVSPAGDVASPRPAFPAALVGVTAVAASDAAMSELTTTSSWGTWVKVVAPQGAHGSAAGTLTAAARVTAFVAQHPTDGAQTEFASLEGRNVVHREASSDRWVLTRERQEFEHQLRRRLDDRRRQTASPPTPTGSSETYPTFAGPSPPRPEYNDGRTRSPRPRRRRWRRREARRDSERNREAESTRIEQQAGADTEPIDDDERTSRPDRDHWIVSTRVLHTDRTPVVTNRCLMTGQDFIAQVVVGFSPPPGALEREPAVLSFATAPPATPLEVVVESLDAELVVVGSTSTEITLLDLDATEDSIGEFRLRTSAVPGQRRLRCNIYARGSLVQSHLLTLEVRTRPTYRDDALVAEVDFNVASTLDADYLDGLRPVDLSLFLNSGDGGETHDLVYRAGDGSVRLSGALRLDGQAVAAAIDDMRKRLHELSWGTKTTWNGEPALYELAKDEEAFFADLAKLALGGYHLWGALFPELAIAAGQQPNAPRERIRGITRGAGVIELGCRDSLRMTLPVGLVYDQRLDDATTPSICPSFRDAYRAGTAMASHVCFVTGCPHEDDETTVCPSGFWGLRHAVSVVRSVTSTKVDAQLAVEALDDTSRSSGVSAIPVDGAAEGLAASTTDATFDHRQDHLQRMSDLFAGSLEVLETRDLVLKRLATSKAQVDYFFCHGVQTADGYPGLVVGPSDGPAITLNNLGEHVRWETTRPLVFLNGCRTAALGPDSLYDLVTTLVQECGAAGVVGTETTVFERTAERFAEAFHGAFVRDRATVAEAVRQARLELLSAGNPLGMVYTPYAPASLHLVNAPQIALNSEAPAN